MRLTRCRDVAYIKHKTRKIVLDEWLVNCYQTFNSMEITLLKDQINDQKSYIN